jgi:hypothetical protein
MPTLTCRCLFGFRKSVESDSACERAIVDGATSDPLGLQIAQQNGPASSKTLAVAFLKGVQAAAPPYLRPRSGSSNPMVRTFENLLTMAKFNRPNATTIKRYTKLLAKAKSLAALLDSDKPKTAAHDARNYQPNQQACYKQCRKLKNCRYGTWATLDARSPGECWLSMHTDESRARPCHNCVSFHVG